MKIPTSVRLRIRDIETRLGCHRQTIWRWYTKGDFPKPHYLGQNRLWFEVEVENWEKSRMSSNAFNSTDPTNPDSFWTKSGSSPPDASNSEGGGA